MELAIAHCITSSLHAVSGACGVAGVSGRASVLVSTFVGTFFVGVLGDLLDRLLIRLILVRAFRPPRPITHMMQRIWRVRLNESFW